MIPPIEHVFVLMLENRSFDHMLGFSGLTGTDAATGKPTTINGVPAGASNAWKGVTFPAQSPAVDPMSKDPAHEFEHVVHQLSGYPIEYPKGGPYPPITNSGFAASYSEDANASDPGEVMKCFTPPGLPNLSKLAQEFAVCDSWYSSMPGPTWPNRCFALAASCSEFDHSPSTPETIVWGTVSGFKFQNGSIFDAAKAGSSTQKFDWRIYSGNVILTMALALKGINITNIRRYARFAGDLQNPNYPAQFTWIEPDYGNPIAQFVGGNSQHPLDGVTHGERLIKDTYEAIRRSPIWDSSMLIITWDEHGGFYDHVAPPPATPPGDKPQIKNANHSGFAFDQYGVRVPAVVISPLIPANRIDHRPYDHASIPATLERLFGLPPMTARDRAALDVTSLASLSSPRSDTPEVLEAGAEEEAAGAEAPLDGLEVPFADVTNPGDLIESQPNLPLFLYLAARADAQLPPPPGFALEAHVANVGARVTGIETREHARAYFEEVRQRALAALPGLELEEGPA